MNRQELFQALDAQAAEVLPTISGLSEAQENFKPSPTVWSVKECFEHISSVEMGVIKLLAMPLPEDESYQEQYGDEKVRDLLMDRSQKRNAPDNVQPKSRFANLAEASAKFEQNRVKLKESITEKEARLRFSTFPHPFLGNISKREWVFMMLGHTWRHFAQIKEVMADANFPA